MDPIITFRWTCSSKSAITSLKLSMFGSKRTPVLTNNPAFSEISEYDGSHCVISDIGSKKWKKFDRSFPNFENFDFLSPHYHNEVKVWLWKLLFVYFKTSFINTYIPGTHTHTDTADGSRWDLEVGKNSKVWATIFYIYLTHSILTAKQLSSVFKNFQVYFKILMPKRDCHISTF